MTTIIGVTAARAQQIEDNSVVGGAIVGNDLILYTHGATQINVGRVIPPIINSHPVGCIYFTDRSANPATYMGGGTWVRWGKGRVPVGIDETAGSPFIANGAEGGEIKHTLTVAEMPSHNHGGSTFEANVPGAHGHTGNQQTGGGPVNSAGLPTGETGTHAHAIGYQGGGAAHNILQPYITCYIWKRTA